MPKARRLIPIVLIAIVLLLATGISGTSCCQCSNWGPVTVTWTGSSPGTWSGNCGGFVPIFSINSGTAISVSSNLTCPPPPNCKPQYSWTVTELTGTSAWNGNNSTALFYPTSPGGFKVELKAVCVNWIPKVCQTCTTIICICEIQPPPCQCEKWEQVTVIWNYSFPGGPTTSIPEAWTGDCGDTLNIVPMDSDLDVHITQITSSINCSTGCTPSYDTWEVTKTSGTPEAPWTGVGLPASFSPASPGSFTVVLNASCDGTSCLPCEFYIDILY